MGQPPPIVLAHAEVLEDLEVLRRVEEDELLVRIESVGENDAVARRLLALGLEDALRAGVSVTDRFEAPIEHGRIVAPRQMHLGFLRYLRALASVFEARPGWRVLSPIPSIEALFDKRHTSARYRALGIPVPESLRASEPDELREAMRARGWRQSYVKLSCGSSASCLAVFSVGPRERLMTTLERAGDERYNSLRVRRVEGRAAIDETLTFLLREGAQIERAIPKARLEAPGRAGRAFVDCRMLVVAGEPAFTVVRSSRHPITNLHLGGFRGDLATFHARVKPAVLAAAHESCRVIAREHGCLHVGVDVLFTPGFEGHRVVEANAFGDLLPNLERDGLNVYEWQVLHTESWLRETGVARAVGHTKRAAR